MCTQANQKLCSNFRFYVLKVNFALVDFFLSQHCWTGLDWTFTGTKHPWLWLGKDHGFVAKNTAADSASVCTKISAEYKLSWGVIHGATKCPPTVVKITQFVGQVSRTSRQGNLVTYEPAVLKNTLCKYFAVVTGLN